MPKFIKKPVKIEAWQWTGVNVDTMVEFLTNGEEKEFTHPVGEMSMERDNFSILFNVLGKFDLYIKTLEGTMFASIGDYIIKGVDGEFYPCKPDIFIRTYDKVE